MIFGSFRFVLLAQKDETQLDSGWAHPIIILPCLGLREKFMREEVWGNSTGLGTALSRNKLLHNHLKQRQSDLFSSGQTSELRRHTGIYNSLRSDWLIAFAVAVVSSPVTHLSPVPLIFSCTSTAKYLLPIQHHVLHAEICQQVWNGFAWIQDQSRLRSRDLCLFCSS